VIITLSGVFTNAPAGHTQLTTGLPADTVNVTGTTTLLFDAVVEPTVIFAEYDPGASPVGSADTSTERGSHTSAMFPVGVAFDHAPPDNVIVADSVPPTLINVIVLCAGAAPSVTHAPNRGAGVGCAHAQQRRRIAHFECNRVADQWCVRLRRRYQNRGGIVPGR
jgi:hypothetical protein